MILGLLGWSSAFPCGVQAEHEGKIQVLLLGDSTTEGSIPRLLKPAGPHLEQVIEQLLAAEGDLPPVHVINTGLSGEYIQRLVETGRYDKVAANLPGIDYVFIRYGLNDRGRRDDFPRNFPADFSQLIARLREDHPQAKIIPMTVIPYFDEAGSAEVNALIQQVAEKEQLPLFDIYPAYAEALKIQGANCLNYRRYPVEKVPAQYQAFVKPYVMSERVVVMDNELDGVLGHLPGWYSDRHPNLAGYNVIAVETAKYLTKELRQPGESKK
ncbi:SGNH/GDSL hydrolase family protein [bacterium]|nr:SGNH/GDSL hydrolase family protein [bacterium]